VSNPEHLSKDAVSIGERLSYCQCATCLPCLARVEIERQSAELVRHESDRVILTQIIEALTAQRDKYKQIAELNAETIKGMQAESVCPLCDSRNLA
jgi:hypothetical protein